MSKFRTLVTLSVVGFLAALVYIPEFSIAIRQALGSMTDLVQEKSSPTTNALAPSEFAGSTDGLAPITPSTQDLDSADLRALRLLALTLINDDRSIHGLPPVALGSNNAAQQHAEDMLRHEYLGHWWVDGRKPYMVYTETGGRSYAAENAAISGWTTKRWEEEKCDALFIQCAVPDPAQAIRDLQWEMMYDDAHADWGHRDNILRDTHRFVSLGIGWNGRFFTFAQHFEGGDAQAVSPPTLTSQGTVSLSLDKTVAGVDVAGVITVYFDPLPTPKTAEQINLLHSYCVGGGFTTECGEPIARVLEPPAPGFSYPNLGAEDVIASEWHETATSFSFVADLDALVQAPGVYTFHVWQDEGRAQISRVLVELSAWQR